MIIDTLANADRYKNVHPLFAKAFAYIKSLQLDTIEPGKYPVEGTDIHASVSNKDGLKAADAKFEAHNNYIDIQVCISSGEQMGWKPRSDCKSPKADYDTARDVIFYTDAPDTYFSLQAGQFVIFYPEDVHAPMIGEGPIKKLVVKVKL